MVSRRPPVLVSDYVIQTLQWMRKNGFKPVALRPGEKAAVDGKYADLDYVPPPDDYWKGSNYGVGIVTGPKHSGPVDIDLDCEEAVFFARIFLPSTKAVFGRLSKRDSHYLYRVAVQELSKRAFVDPITGTTIIELRADGGHQTVMPGSIHQGTGERVEWSTIPFPEITTVEVDLLVRAVMKIAIAVLIVRHMWHDGQRNQINLFLAGVFHRLEWTEDEVVELIEAVMSYCGDDDKTRRITIHNTWNRAERGQKVAGATKLREFLKEDKAVDAIMSWAGNEAINVVQEYNDRYAAVLYGGQFRVALTDTAPGEQITFMEWTNFLRWTSWDTVMIPDSKGEPKPVPKAKIWVTAPRHRSYAKVEFLPGLDDPPPDVLNLWTGWSIQPKAGCCDAWMRLLREVICGNDEQLVSWLLHWFANIVREPMQKSMTAPVFMGNQGVGKSLMLDYFGKILGSSYVVVSNPEHIHGKFNRHLATALLLHSAEALYSGDKKHRAIIKSLITDRELILEPKNVDAISVKNWLRLALTSNDLNAAAAEAGDRRYTGIDTEDRALPLELRDAVLEEMRGDGPAALFHFLLTMDYDLRVPRVNVKNESLNRLKSSNYSPTEAWWYDRLCEGTILPSILRWASIPSEDDWPPIVSTSALHASMVLRSRDHGVRAPPDSNIFMAELKKIVGRKFVPVRRSYSNDYVGDTTAPQIVRMLSDRQNSIVDMPDLATCRAAFEKHTGQKISWSPDHSAQDEDWKAKRRKEKGPDF